VSEGCSRQLRDSQNVGHTAHAGVNRNFVGAVLIRNRKNRLSRRCNLASDQSSQRLHGVIYRVPDPKKLWGFIDCNGQRIFCHQVDFLPDSIGRRPLTIGSEVEFDLALVSGKKPKAVNIRHIFVDEIDPLTHREVSLLTSWNADKRLGFLERESGDHIALFANHIEHFNVIASQLAPGLWVSHGVKQSADNPSNWYGTQAVIHLPEAETAVADTEKRTTLRDLIRSKQS
jgi:cold shock CspA family protein